LNVGIVLLVKSDSGSAFNVILLSFYIILAIFGTFEENAMANAFALMH